MQDRSHRYDIYRPLTYRYRGKKGFVRGAGKSLNISRRGMLFQAEEDLPIGKRVEIVVQMGNVAEGEPEVNLQVHGVIVRCAKGKAAAVIKRYKLNPKQMAAKMAV